MGWAVKEGAVQALGRWVGRGLLPWVRCSTGLVLRSPPTKTAPVSGVSHWKTVPSKSVLWNLWVLPSRIKSQHNLLALTSHFSRHQEPLRELKWTKGKIVGHVIFVEQYKLFLVRSNEVMMTCPEACFSLFHFLWLLPTCPWPHCSLLTKFT